MPGGISGYPGIPPPSGGASASRRRRPCRLDDDPDTDVAAAHREAADWDSDTGVAAGWVLALSVGRGGPGFRSHVALDALTIRLLPRARLTVPAGVLILVCVALTAAGIWFQPEAWPLGG